MAIPSSSAMHLASWLHKVTRNACMDAMRSETRRKRREHEAAIGEGHSGGLTLSEERDTRAAVRRELEKLPVDQREVLVLRLLDDRSYKEIAEITAKKIGTVGWLISVGLKTLGEHLQPLSTEPAASRGSWRAWSPVARGGLDLVQGELSMTNETHDRMYELLCAYVPGRDERTRARRDRAGAGRIGRAAPREAAPSQARSPGQDRAGPGRGALARSARRGLRAALPTARRSWYRENRGCAAAAGSCS
jgi:hypothetical protein